MIAPTETTGNLFAAVVTDGTAYRMRAMRVDQLPASGVSSTPELRASMELHGFHPAFPLVLRESGGIVFGRRRITTAKEVLATDTLVPVVVVPDDATLTALLVLAENLARSRNVAAEADAVKTLVAEGKTPDEIRNALVLTKKQLSDLVALTQLPNAIWRKFQLGEIKATAALGITRFPSAIVNVLVEMANAGERITGKTVREIRVALRDRTMDQLPDELFAAPERDGSGEPDGGDDQSGGDNVTGHIANACQLADHWRHFLAEQPDEARAKDAVEALADIGRRLRAALRMLSEQVPQAQSPVVPLSQAEQLERLERLLSRPPSSCCADVAASEAV